MENIEDYDDNIKSLLKKIDRRFKTAKTAVPSFIISKLYLERSRQDR